MQTISGMSTQFGSREAGKTQPATSAQLSYLTGLAKRVGETVNVEKITKTEASEQIDQLLARMRATKA